MIPRCLKVLLPVVPDRSSSLAAGVPASPAAMIAAGVAASSGADSPTAAGLSPPAAVDHRVSAGTDDLWLALVRRLGA